MYCHVLVDCEYMLWMIGGVLRPDSGVSEEGVDVDIIYVLGITRGSNLNVVG
jgi:hypothetical protein